MQLSKNDKLQIFENAITWIVVFAMFVYGAGKIVQFNGANQMEKSVSQLTGMELMWAFYGYSFKFAIFLGILEITSGILMLINKTRLIGCLVATTILVNVIVQDLVFGVHIGALRAAILYQVIICIIFWLNKEKLITTFKNLLVSNSYSESTNKVIIKLGIAFFLFVAIRVLEYFITI